ncbi:hypothetical protein BDK51DRAFT_40634 [Blyttiomyces helicus]|uniref:Uncharacterized protein n=1 Tax=Blyttiomyces helicus TaxID=388810 RepID=A0A4P9WDA8_9FUNG|nr:hypothetical protein BDK51DRAFT_40634 [Blyttiomyces helicus]|eukprot:RKO89633.1 hypothetical protein BDK51DRAFT_40634 [Blyttiomyces helicus]
MSATPTWAANETIDPVLIGTGFQERSSEQDGDTRPPRESVHPDDFTLLAGLPLDAYTLADAPSLLICASFDFPKLFLFFPRPAERVESGVLELAQWLNRIQRRRLNYDAGSRARPINQRVGRMPLTVAIIGELGPAVQEHDVSVNWTAGAATPRTASVHPANLSHRASARPRPPRPPSSRQLKKPPPDAFTLFASLCKPFICSSSVSAVLRIPRIFLGPRRTLGDLRGHKAA